MVPPTGPEPPIFREFRDLLGNDVPLQTLGRFEFYEAARDKIRHLLLLPGAKVYANILLTIGVVPPPAGKRVMQKLTTHRQNHAVSKGIGRASSKQYIGRVYHSGESTFRRKVLKRLITGVVVFCMVLGLGSMAFAQTGKYPLISGLRTISWRQRLAPRTSSRLQLG